MFYLMHAPCLTTIIMSYSNIAAVMYNNHKLCSSSPSPCPSPSSFLIVYCSWKRAWASALQVGTTAWHNGHSSPSMSSVSDSEASLSSLAGHSCSSALSRAELVLASAGFFKKLRMSGNAHHKIKSCQPNDLALTSIALTSSWSDCALVGKLDA